MTVAQPGEHFVGKLRILQRVQRKNCALTFFGELCDRFERDSRHAEIAENIVFAGGTIRKVNRDSARGTIQHSRGGIELRKFFTKVRIDIAGGIGRIKLSGAPENNFRRLREHSLPDFRVVVVVMSLHIVIV